MTVRFMKIKKVVIPFITLVIMTGQLAGCATKTSQEMVDSMDESPDVSMEQTVPDASQQSLEASGVVNKQDEQKLEEYSPDELIALFKSQYEISKEIYHSDTEETIQTELENIRYTAEFQEKSLPSDYEAQYREWRPSVVQQDTQTTETAQQPQSQQSQQSQDQQGQSSKPQGYENPNIVVNEEDRGSLEGWDSFGEVITDPSQISTGISNPYDGYGEVNIGYGG